MGKPHVDKDTTGKAKSHAFDPTSVQVYEFFVEGRYQTLKIRGC